MTAPIKPWETNSLQNSAQIRKYTDNSLRELPTNTRSAPVLPPLPRSATMAAPGYMPLSSGYSSMGYGGYSAYGMPYRSSPFSSMGGYSSYGMYGMGGYGGYGGYPALGPGDDAERRFVQYAEESSRQTFASVESIVRAVNSISMMLDNTFFAMTSSFRAVLGVAENFGRLRSMFGHIWYSVNVFRLFSWLYRKLMALLGRKVASSGKEVSAAWKQAANGAPPLAAGGGSSWPTLAFLGVLVSAPYIISKFLPKYEDKCNPATWKTPGIRAKAAFDFAARTSSELSVQTNNEVTLAPTYVQEAMNLRNSGWAFAVSGGRSGVVPLNYLVINKSVKTVPTSTTEVEMPVPRTPSQDQHDGAPPHKTHTKRVSFGENQIFENVDLEDYVTGKKEVKGAEGGAKSEEKEKGAKEREDGEKSAEEREDREESVVGDKVAETENKSSGTD